MSKVGHIDLQRGSRRGQIRALKKAARLGIEPGASAIQQSMSKRICLELLGRSVRFGHHKLTLVRLKAAIDVGADVPPEVLLACRGIFEQAGSAALRPMFEEILRSAKKYEIAEKQPNR